MTTASESRKESNRLANRAKIRWLYLILPTILFLFIFYFWPVIDIFSRSISDPPGIGLQNYYDFFVNETFIKVFFRTVQTALIVTFFTLLIGYPYAYLITKETSRMSSFLLIAVLLPFWSSLLVRSYAWTVILRDTGVLNTFLINIGVIAEPLEIIRTPIAVQIGLTHVLLPFMVLPLYAVMQKIDVDLDFAARNLGANSFKSFIRVFLPMSLSGILAGSLLVFVLSLGYFITPSLLGGPRDLLLGELIVSQVSQLLDWGMGSTMAVILTLITLIIIGIAAKFVELPDIFGSSSNE
jgi:ABC-type spermidine/putrescine transport system permease subunit I